mmetsp:Transcript_19264/g.56039  ORF Transcript_19264/g.56039 Transcript_19264/m.56039 type:complete len:296 (-) Transcript_19264:7-894(-)
MQGENRLYPISRCQRKLTPTPLPDPTATAQSIHLVEFLAFRREAAARQEPCQGLKRSSMSRYRETHNSAGLVDSLLLVDTRSFGEGRLFDIPGHPQVPVACPVDATSVGHEFDHLFFVLGAVKVRWVQERPQFLLDILDLSPSRGCATVHTLLLEENLEHVTKVVRGRDFVLVLEHGNQSALGQQRQENIDKGDQHTEAKEEVNGLCAGHAVHGRWAADESLRDDKRDQHNDVGTWEHVHELHHVRIQGQAKVVGETKFISWQVVGIEEHVLEELQLGSLEWKRQSKVEPVAHLR